jgi:hypothetical protein
VDTGRGQALRVRIFEAGARGQHAPLSTRKPNAIHPCKPYEQTPTRVGGESGQHHPRLLLRLVPHHPSALPLLGAGRKGHPAADLGLAGA